MGASGRKQLLQAAEACIRSGQADRARAALESLITADPSSSRAFELLGYVHGNQGRLEDALACLERACLLPGATAEAHYYRGVALMRQGRAEPAIDAFDKSLALAGPFFEALHERGTACSRLGRHSQALESYLQASRFRPDDFGLVFNLAKVYDELKDHVRALAHYDRALMLQPGSADAWAHKGALLYDAQRYADAIPCWERALAIDPGIEHLRGFLLHARLRLADWRTWEAEKATLLERLAKGEAVCGPFELLAITADAQLQHAAARNWAQAAASVTTGPPLARSTAARRIRVGYFSADFGRHAVSHLIAELCEVHDRSAFEIYAIALSRGSADDEMRARLERAFDHFIEVAHLPDEAIVQRARSLSLDVAVDLGGHTRGARTAIFASRVAPVQVNYLGYPGTLGADFIDYLIADETVIPAGTREHYSERVVWLPDSFQPSDTRRTLTGVSRSRLEWGLPETGFVFCCFNNTFKINPEVFQTWLRILSQVDGACLWLLADNETVRRNLTERAALGGVDPARLVFADRLPMAEYLGRYQQADLFLDTLPFNAGTTASDALFAGLPILTCPGQAFASRMAASLLAALGLPELVATSWHDYEARAVRLARSPEEVMRLKSRLEQARNGAPLFDMRTYAAHLEAAYREMCSLSARGLPPKHLPVDRSAGRGRPADGG